MTAPTRLRGPQADRGARPTRPRRPSMLSTRVLLVCAAFGALGTVLMLGVSPLTSAIAAWFPPAYAVVAGIHSVLPFLARRLLGVPFAATLVAGIEGVLSSAFTPLGVLIIVPLVLSAGVFDAVLALSSRRGRANGTANDGTAIVGTANDGAARDGTATDGTAAYLAAAAFSALALFAVSLPVIDPARLTLWMIVGTLLGRLIGQLLALGAATAIAGRVFAAGIMRPHASSR